ncbi:MAG: TatD family deoxyribonuclease, partial [Bacteroidetes bacterium]
MLIDTHAHLYSKKFDHDREEMLQRAIAAGVGQFLLPNIDRESIESMLALEAAHPDRCHAMMGLHPCSVQANYQEELAVVRDWLDKRPFLAVGEIGIDLYWDKTYLEEQKEAFLLQVEWALELDLPIVIHARESLDLLIELVRGVGDKRLRGVFHCFTGSLAQAQAIIELGFYLGIGGVATYKNSGLTETLAQLPLSAIILETDAPYLAPVPKRGKRNESAYVRYVA